MILPVLSSGSYKNAPQSYDLNLDDIKEHLEVAYKTLNECPLIDGIFFKNIADTGKFMNDHDVEAKIKSDWGYRNAELSVNRKSALLSWYSRADDTTLVVTIPTSELEKEYEI